MTEERDSEGGCTRYAYDCHHNLEEKSMLVAGDLSGEEGITVEKSIPDSAGTGKWIRERCSYDRYGRLHYKGNANGNHTSCRYAGGHPQRLFLASMYPKVGTSPEGYEYYCRTERGTSPMRNTTT